MRLFALLARTCLCGGLLYPSAPGAEGYDFGTRIRAYQYETTQEVVWASVGDQVRSTTSMTWKLILKGKGPGEAAVTVLRVQARHEGPGVRREVDSAADPGTEPDPLLGHLTALEGVTFGLTVEPTTGVVRAVTGTDMIAKRVAAAFPNLLDPAAPSPIADQARALYSPDHLGKLWTAVLALPSGPAHLPLAGPQGGTLVRTWTGDAWTATLAEPEVAVRLGRPPTDITGVLTGMTGQGTLRLAEGLPQEATGEVAFVLRLTALTQPVESRHRLRWRLTEAR